MLTVFILISAALVAVVSLLWGCFGLSGLTFSHRLSRGHAFFGERLEYFQEITNNKLLPLPGLWLKRRCHRTWNF